MKKKENKKVNIRVMEEDLFQDLHGGIRSKLYRDLGYLTVSKLIFLSDEIENAIIGQIKDE